MSRVRSGTVGVRMLLAVATCAAPALSATQAASATVRKPGPGAPARSLAPTFGKTVEVVRVRGVVAVKLPGAGSGFAPLTGPRLVPLGAEFDATGGAVTLVTATGRRGRARGDFGGGNFTVEQSPRATEIVLVDARPANQTCARVGKGASIARHHLSREILDRLRVTDHGSYTTRGSYSAAVVRGTSYSIVDECDGTFTEVLRGKVAIEDFVQRKTVTISTGQSYFAAALVMTGPATGTSSTSAELTGSVNPNGDEITGCGFEYGPTEAYGSLALCSVSPGAGFSLATVSADLSGLAPDGVIHFRAVATNKGGTSTGSDATFRTKALPAEAASAAANDITASTAHLSAVVAFHGGLPERCEFEYGATTAYGQRAPCAPAPGVTTASVGVSAEITGLHAQSVVHFRIVAANESGTGTGNDVEFTTLPSAPSIVAGVPSEVSEEGFTIHATVDPHGTQVTSCEFEYGATTEYGKVLPCTPAPGSGEAGVAVSAQIRGIHPNEVIHYRLVAASAGGTAESPDATEQTLPRPVKPFTLAAEEVTETGAKLTAQILTEDAPVSRCEFQYGLTEAYGSSAPCSTVPTASFEASDVSATVTGLSPTSTYHFRIVAANRHGVVDGVDRTLNTPPNPLTLEALPLFSFINGLATVRATVSGAAPHEAEGVRVRFVVSGANPHAGEVETNEAGEAAFEYLGEDRGEDHVRVSIIKGSREFSGELTTVWIGEETAVEAEEISEPVHALRSGAPAGQSASERRIQAEVSPRLEPVLGQLVDVVPVSGHASYRPPGAAEPVPIEGVLRIPVSSEIDAAGAVLGVVSATGSGTLQTAEAGGARFEVLQGAGQGGLTELALVDPAHSACRRTPQKVLTRLNVSEDAAFTARGRFGTAAATGPTVFSLADQCRGTFVLDTLGEVHVRDLARKKSVRLRTGQHYRTGG